MGTPLSTDDLRELTSFPAPTPGLTPAHKIFTGLPDESGGAWGPLSALLELLVPLVKATRPDQEQGAPGQLYVYRPVAADYARVALYRWLPSGTWDLLADTTGSLAAGPTVTLQLSATTSALGRPVTLTAHPASGSSLIRQVQFYSGAQLLGAATAEPFQLDFQPPAVGDYTLTTVATDQAGQRAKSDPVLLHVQTTAQNLPPRVTLVATPASVTLGQAVTLTATADDPDVGDAVVAVQFYAPGSTPLGQPLGAAPYAATFTPATVGQVVALVKATDKNNASTTTQAIITVTPPPALVGISLSGPDSVSEGSSGSYSAEAVYNNGTHVALSSGDVTWTNAPGGVLTVPTNATTGDSRKVTITASYGGKSANKDVTILDTTPAGGGTTQPTATAPTAAPTIGASTAGNNTARATWTDVPTSGNGGSAITGCRVYRVGTVAPLATVAPGTQLYDDAGAANGTAVQYQVTAVNAVGEGPKSAASAAVTPAAPASTTPDTSAYLTLNPGQSDAGATLDAQSKGQLKYAPSPALQKSDTPGNTMYLCYPDLNTPIAQLDYAVADEGHACSYVLNGVEYLKNAVTGQYLTFTSSNTGGNVLLGN